MEKTLVVVRHGEGHHQTTGKSEPGLGALLTDNGLTQAKMVAQDPLFHGTLKMARQPLFVSSNLIRAVQTLVHAAPGRAIVVQPLARERIANHFDWPSHMDVLADWLRGQNVEADLGPYQEELCKVRNGGAVQDEDSDSDSDDDLHKHYIRTLIRSDTKNRSLLGLGRYSAIRERARRLLTWIAARNADAVFLVSHGAFLMHVDALACGSSHARALWRSVSGRAYMKNCEVRVYRMQYALPSPGWAISHSASDETLSSSGSSSSMITCTETSDSECESLESDHMTSSSGESHPCCIGHGGARQNE